MTRSARILSTVALASLLVVGPTGSAMAAVDHVRIDDRSVSQPEGVRDWLCRIVPHLCHS